QRVDTLRAGVPVVAAGLRFRLKAGLRTGRWSEAGAGAAKEGRMGWRAQPSAAPRCASNDKREARTTVSAADGMGSGRPRSQRSAASWRTVASSVPVGPEAVAFGLVGAGAEVGELDAAEG